MIRQLRLPLPSGSESTHAAPATACSHTTTHAPSDGSRSQKSEVADGSRSELYAKASYWQNPGMKISLITTVFVAASGLAVSLFGQQTATSPVPAQKKTNMGQVMVPDNSKTAKSAGKPSKADMDKMMQQMMEMSKLNENHKLLSSLDGDWDYTVKMWMDGNTNATPQESKGVATRKTIMDGRYVTMDVNGTMQMPGADGKPADVPFHGMGLEGYDNVKKKFVASWIDSMGTGIEFSEGKYDPATKTFTYSMEMEPMPGMKTKVREVVKIVDDSHMMLEWYETQAGKEKKTMEISYTKKS